MSSSTLGNSAWRKRNPDKVRAHWTVQNAVRAGILKSKPCSCGTLKTHAHHEDYTKPCAIKWLCSACHRRLHALEKGQVIGGKKYKSKSKPYERLGRNLKRMRLPDAKKLRRAGYSYRKIGEILNVSASQVFKVLNKSDYK